MSLNNQLADYYINIYEPDSVRRIIYTDSPGLFDMKLDVFFIEGVLNDEFYYMEYETIKAKHRPYLSDRMQSGRSGKTRKKL